MSQFTTDISEYREKIMPLRYYLETGCYPEGTSDLAKRNIRKKKEKYQLKDGVLYYVTRSKTLVQVLTREEDIIQVLTQCHSNLVGGGHTGIVTTREKVGSRYFWNNWCKHVEEFVSTCQACQKFEKVQTQAPQLRQIKVPEPMELVGFDLIGDSSNTSDQNAFLDESPLHLPSLELDCVCVPTALPNNHQLTAAVAPMVNKNLSPAPLSHSLPTTTATPTDNGKKGFAEKGTVVMPCPKQAASARRAINVDDDDEEDTPFVQRLQQNKRQYRRLLTSEIERAKLDRRSYRRLLTLEIERAKLKLKAARENQEMHEIALKRQKVALEIDNEKLKNQKLKNMKLKLELMQMQQPAESVQVVRL